MSIILGMLSHRTGLEHFLQICEVHVLNRGFECWHKSWIQFVLHSAKRIFFFKKKKYFWHSKLLIMKQDILEWPLGNGAVPIYNDNNDFYSTHLWFELIGLKANQPWGWFVIFSTDEWWLFATRKVLWLWSHDWFRDDW